MVKSNLFKFYFVSVFCCFCICSTDAQHQPYHYEVQADYLLTYQPDSTDKSSTKTELFCLLIGNKQSLFCSNTYLLVDSAWSSNLSKGNTFGPSMQFFSSLDFKDNRFVIFKTDEHIISYDQYARYIPDIFTYTQFKYQIKWEISKDTMSIKNVLCQKAETTFGNRTWIAWFASSIPISDGPYKFCGLPGLILKINDIQQYWSFNLVSISNIEKSIKILFYNRIPVKIRDNETFLAQRKFARDNRLQIMVSRGVQFSNKELAGKTFADNARKDNNWIELYQEK